MRKNTMVRWDTADPHRCFWDKRFYSTTPRAARVPVCATGQTDPNPRDHRAGAKPMQAQRSELVPVTH